jgi:hypothetical protein
VYSRIFKELPCSIVQEFSDGWKLCFPMELGVPDEPGCFEGRPEEFVLHDLQFVELRVAHVSPHRRAVHHGWSDYRSVDSDFVLYGHLTSPIDQRIKLS